MRLNAGVILLMLFFLTAINVKGQNTSEAEAEKKFAKAGKLFDNGKPEEAEKILLEIADEFPYSPAVWNKLVQVQMYVYETKKSSDNLFKNLSFTVTDKDGKDLKNDTIGSVVSQVLSSFKPSDTYKQHIIYTCRKATCYTHEADFASVLLRNFEVDAATDKGVTKEAWKQFQLAEKEFQAKNYNGAAKYYKKAIELDPTFYKAKLYLGDVYFFTKHYNLAIESFKAAVDIRPDLLEPRKYLVDALAYSDAYEKAYEESIGAILIYPDLSMKQKMEDAAKLAGFNCRFNPIERDAFPNCKNEIKGGENDTPMKTHADSPWNYYKEAAANVIAYSDENGILAPNPVTKHKYLEVYSFDYMLQKSDLKALDYARKMKEAGFLDCYVMISCFHHDFYQQYLSFVADNKSRIKSYFDMLKTL